MSMSKTTNTYNRQNWEDSVSFGLNKFYSYNVFTSFANYVFLMLFRISRFCAKPAWATILTFE